MHHVPDAPHPDALEASTAPAQDGPELPDRSGVPDRDDPRDRGDVPGWVLVTLMTAGLVLALWAVAGPALTDLFEQAIERVGSYGG